MGYFASSRVENEEKKCGGGAEKHAEQQVVTVARNREAEMIVLPAISRAGMPRRVKQGKKDNAR